MLEDYHNFWNVTGFFVGSHAPMEGPLGQTAVQGPGAPVPDGTGGAQ